MTNYDIKIFFSILQNGNMTKAAEELAMTEAALSRRVKLLEVELGYPLFNRGKGIRSISLTQYGRDFIPIAVKWTSLWQETKELSRKKHRLLLRLSANPSLSYSLTDLYESFSKSNPDLFLEISTLYSLDAYARILDNSLDLAFVSQPNLNSYVNPHLAFTEPYVFVYGPMGTFNQITDARELPFSEFITTTYDDILAGWVADIFKDEGFPYMMLHNISDFIRMLQHGNHWSILPYTTAVIASAENKLSYRRLEHGPRERQCYYLINEKIPSESMSRFLQALGKYCLQFPDIRLSPEIQSLISEIS